MLLSSRNTTNSNYPAVALTRYCMMSMGLAQEDEGVFLEKYFLFFYRQLEL